MEAEGEGWDPVKIALVPLRPSNLLLMFQGDTGIVVLFVKCSVVFHLHMFFFKELCKLKIYSVRVVNFLGKGCQLCLPSVLLCVCLIVFVCLSL